MTDGGVRQRNHYEQILTDYEAHYYDATAMEFRRRFLYDVMFRGLDLDGKDVADLAAGSGYNSLALRERFPSARVVGFDIAPTACESYRRKVGAEAIELDLTSDADVDLRFDAAMIVGGLHHCVTNLPATFRSVSRMLKPGGLFLMYEPNARYLLEALRKFWYRHDRYFDAQTEHALDHDACAAMAAASGFVPIDRVYSGGPAYFLICNSLVFRVPVAIKRYAAPLLFPLEAAYNRLPWARAFPTFIARWKKEAPSALARYPT